MALFNLHLKKQGKTTNLAGGEAFVQSAELHLLSLLLTSFVQDQFYRNAKDTLSTIQQLLEIVDAEFAAKAAVYARREMGMRSITHYLAAAVAQKASGTSWARYFYDQVVRRPDDMLEICAAYHQLGGTHLSNAMKKGFASALNRFDGYQLAKYRGEDKVVKLVDLVNMIHPKANERNAVALQNLVAGTLKNTNTWEAKLSEAGQVAADKSDKAKLKAEAWAELLQQQKLGYLALLRNLRNMAEQAPDLIHIITAALTNRAAIKKSLVLPFQIMVAMEAIEQSLSSAKRQLADALSDALELSLDNVPRFAGRTLVVLDDSGSMSTHAKGSGIGSRSCLELGAVFAAALYKSNDADLMRFSDEASYVQVNGRDAMMSIAQNLIKNARAAGTNFHAIFEQAKGAYDRIIILSDMQGWVGGYTPEDQYQGYKKRTGASPYIYSFDLAAYGSLQFPESNVFCLAGFSDKVFDIMQVLETDRDALLHKIEGISWK